MCVYEACVLSTLLSVAASRGQPTPGKSGDSTDSPSAPFGACCTSGGRTEIPLIPQEIQVVFV